MDYAGQFYPNPDNFAEGSFPQPLTPPDIDPDQPDLILVEYGTAWTEVLMAAVDQLRLYSTWEGDHDAKILAVNRAEQLKFLLQEPVIIPEEDWPTPYWDEGSDVEDQEPEDTQDWYGQVEDALAPADELTFQENAVIWLLTGFVAVATSPTGPGAIGAAIFFRTLAKRFVLAFNRGDTREVIRVVIDAADYEVVDTDGMSAGDIVEVIVDGLEDLDTHDILLVHTM